MGDRSISLLSQKDGGLDTDLQKADQLSPQIMASSSSRPPVNSVGHCAICLKNCFRVLDEENTCVVDEYYQRKDLDSGQNTYGQALGQDPHGQLINVTGQDLGQASHDQFLNHTGQDPHLKVLRTEIVFRPMSVEAHSNIPKPNILPDTRTCYFDKGKQVISSQDHSLIFSKARDWKSATKTCSEGWDRQNGLEPGNLDKYRVKSVGYTRTIRPKNRSDFVRGKICRWESLNGKSNSLNSDANHDSTSKGKFKNLGKGSFVDSKPLKVYSRSKARMKSVNVGVMERKGVLLERKKKTWTQELMKTTLYFINLIYHPAPHFLSQRMNLGQKVLQRNTRTRN